MLEKLSKNILKTITYYDVMDYPMTVFEIWKYLINNQETMNNSQGTMNNDQKREEKNTLTEIIKELESEELKKNIEEYQGFYFLRGRKNLASERLKRNKISEEKFKIIRKTAKWIKIVPFVKMIAVAGRVAAKNAEKGSDLDIFIIFRQGRIFTGRFLVTALVHFLGKRRHGKKINNRICLNHFITDENKICIKDLYSSQVYSWLVPIFGQTAFSEFLKDNGWIGKYRPNFKVGGNNSKIIRDTFFSKTLRDFLEKVFSANWLEEKLENWQTEKIKNNPKTKKSGGMIICSDTELAFWPDFQKQGPRIFQKFQEKLTKLN